MKVVKLALVIPHGNAEVESGFSKSGRVITSDRTNLSLSTINACMTIKDAVKGYERVLHLIPIPMELIKRAKQAHSSYMTRLEKEKEEQETKKSREISQLHDEEAKKRVEEEKQLKNFEELKDLTKNVATLRTEKDKTEEVTGNLLEEANNRLKEALKKKDLTGIAVAQLMLEACEGQYKKGRESDKKLKCKEKTLLKRQTSVMDLYFSKKPKI